MNFKVRKQGYDLKDNKNYNQWDGEVNPFFPEFAPKLVGGTASSLAFKETKGNCTWYVSGRLSEVFGYMPPRPKYRPNAKDWGTNGEPLSNGPVVGGVVVFGDSGYGHVAFIEKIVDGVAYLSESSYSTRGNDFLFKYGRTIDQVCREWNMTVLRYLAPFEPSTSYDDVATKPVDDKVVQDVRDGVYGNDPVRSRKLTELGYDAHAVQKAVNAAEGSASTVKPEPVKNRTGQTLVIFGNDLQGSQEVELLRANKSSYGKGAGITCNRGQIKKYKILEEITDGFYKIHVPNANPQTVYVQWRPGIGFER